MPPTQDKEYRMKLINVLLWSSLLATVAPSVWAQANTIPSQPHLLVKGEARRVVMPDRFGLELSLEETDVDAGAARQRVQANVARVLDLFRTHRAVEGSIRAENLRVVPSSRYEDRKQVFLGSKVSRQVRASFGNPQDLQAFLGALKTSESLQIKSLSPAYSGEVELRRALKSEAAAQTRASAQALATAYGAKIRGLYSISDVAPDFAYGVEAGEWPQSPGRDGFSTGDDALDGITVTGSRLKDAAPAPESIEGGPITYTENVYAIFLISDGT
jgi:uncharacterized protein